jgi:threonine dehydrogenase-like Zn-dependent dehydrogenase
MKTPVDFEYDIGCVPRRTLANGAQIPVVGMGTFGFDKYSPDTVASAVVEAAKIGYRHMEELVERLVRWGIHPDKLITHRFSLEHASEAYALMAGGNCNKVRSASTKN